MISFIWLILRTGTKPSRANYPCQKVARFNVEISLTPIFATFATWIPTITKQKKLFSENFVSFLIMVLLLTSLLTSTMRFQETIPLMVYEEGDIDSNNVVDIFDLQLLGKAYNSTPGDSNWNSNCDLNSDFIVNELDLEILASNYGIRSSVNSTVFIVTANYTENVGNLYPAITKLFETMEQNGQDIYELVQPSDVVIIKVNCQWPHRGGTNTDLVKALVQKIVEHPQSWDGEIVIADNGQGRGSLDWAESNSYYHNQSMLDVADYFAGLGYKVSTFEWEDINTVVQEFEDGDYNDGYVTTPLYYEGYPCSYPKFQTKYGRYISLNRGIWNGSSYDRNRLKIINIPVLKTHSSYGVTSVVKHYMGVVSQPVSNTHYYLEYGAMGDILHLAYPDLNIIDAIYVNPEPWDGPQTPYGQAVLVDTILASTDPIALDYIGSKDVLMPVAEAQGFNSSSIDPDLDVRGTWNWGYRQYLVASYNKLLGYGYSVTMDRNRITVIKEGTA